MIERLFGKMKKVNNDLSFNYSMIDKNFKKGSDRMLKLVNVIVDEII